MKYHLSSFWLLIICINLLALFPVEAMGGPANKGETVVSQSKKKSKGGPQHAERKEGSVTGSKQGEPDDSGLTEVTKDAHEEAINIAQEPPQKSLDSQEDSSKLVDKQKKSLKKNRSREARQKKPRIVGKGFGKNSDVTPQTTEQNKPDAGLKRF